jgi:hypothetical protein
MRAAIAIVLIVAVGAPGCSSRAAAVSYFVLGGLGIAGGVVRTKADYSDCGTGENAECTEGFAGPFLITLGVGFLVAGLVAYARTPPPAPPPPTPLPLAPPGTVPSR